jgi:hypothetical protein
MLAKMFTLSPITIATAGTAQSINPASSVFCSSVIVTADAANTGKVYVGGSNVAAANGQPLSAGEALVVTSDDVRGSASELDIKDIYVDTQTNANVVRVAYIARK